MSKQYDVIVIGAGNGGLAAAADCAREGLSTLLLERHNIPGGSASSFVRAYGLFGSIVGKFVSSIL